MPNRLDVINIALRRLKILSADNAATADMADYAGDILDSLFAEVKEVHAMPFTWTLAATPSAALLPLGYLLAVEVAPHYNQPSEPRSRAMARLRAYAFPDDRTDRRDSDADGVVSDAEAAAAARATYF